VFPHHEHEKKELLYSCSDEIQKEKEKENKEEGIFRKNGVNGEMPKSVPSSVM
jgi:hypothetical protein